MSNTQLLTCPPAILPATTEIVGLNKFIFQNLWSTKSLLQIFGIHRSILNRVNSFSINNCISWDTHPNLIIIPFKPPVPPVLWIPNQLVGAALGRDVTLDCHTEAYPSSINYWGRRPGEMIISNDKLKVTTKEKSYKTHMRLTIKNLQPEDLGSYMCYSKNSLGATEGTVRLHGKYFN